MPARLQPAALLQRSIPPRPYGCSAPSELHISMPQSLRSATRLRSSSLHASTSLHLQRASSPPSPLLCIATPAVASIPPCLHVATPPASLHASTMSLCVP